MNCFCGNIRTIETKSIYELKEGPEGVGDGKERMSRHSSGQIWWISIDLLLCKYEFFQRLTNNDLSTIIFRTAKLSNIRFSVRQF